MFKTAYLKLIKEKAIKHGHFILASGQESNFYVDIRVLTLDTIGLTYMLDGIQMIIDQWQEPFDAIGGPALGAVPIIGAYLHYSRHTPKQGFIVRPQAKDHGLTSRLIGDVANKRVIMIEDVVTTGQSVTDAIQVVEQAGATVIGIIVMFDRQQGAATLLSNYRFATLANIKDV